MLIDDVFDETADTIVCVAEVLGDAFNAVKCLVTDCYLMLVVLTEFNRRKESPAVIVKVALTLLGG